MSQQRRKRGLSNGALASRIGIMLLLLTILSILGSNMSCIIDQPSITLGDRFTEPLTADSLETGILTCKVVTIGECKQPPTLLLVSSTGEKKVVNTFKVISEDHAGDSSNLNLSSNTNLNFNPNSNDSQSSNSKSSKRAHYFKLTDVEFDRDYQWSVNGDNNLGPFPFKFRDKSEYGEYSFVVVSYLDFSEASSNTHRALQETNWTHIDGFVHSSGISPSLNLDMDKPLDSLGIDSYFKSIASTITKKPFFPILGPKDTNSFSNSVDLSFILPGQHSVSGNPWNLPPVYYFRQGTALIVMVDSWTLFATVSDLGRNQHFSQLDHLLSNPEDKFTWKVVFLSTSMNCHPLEPGCAGAGMYYMQPLRELFYKNKVNLVVESQPGVSRIVRSNYLLATINLPRNPHAENVLDSRLDPVFVLNRFVVWSNSVFVNFGSSGSKYTQQIWAAKVQDQNTTSRLGLTRTPALVQNKFVDSWADSPLYYEFSLFNLATGKPVQVPPGQGFPTESFLKLKIKNAYLDTKIEIFVSIE